MSGRDFDERVRTWMDAAAPDRLPPSLRETVERVTSAPAPIPARHAHAGLRVVRLGLAAAVVAAVVVGGAYLYRTEQGPAATATPSVAPASPSPRLGLGTPELATTLDATVPVLAGADGYVLATGWDPRAGGGCGPVPAVIIGNDGGIAQTSGWDGQIFAAAPMYTGGGALALGLDTRCAPMLLAADGRFAWQRVELPAEVAGLGGMTGTPEPWSANELAVWDANRKVIELVGKGGTSVLAPDAIAPALGSAQEGLYWVDASRRVRLVERTPGSGGATPNRGPRLTLPKAAPGRGVLFGNAVVFEESGGGLGLGRFDGTIVDDTLPGFTVWQFAAGRNFVAALGDFGGEIAVAVSADGIHWDRAATGIASTKRNGSTEAIAVTASRVYFGVLDPNSGHAAVYSVSVELPAPAPPSPPATPSAPVAPSPIASPSEPPAPPSATGPIVKAIAFADATHGLAVGGDGFDNSNGVVATTDDGGKTWQQRVIGAGPFEAAAAAGSLEWIGRGCSVVDAPCDPGIWQSADRGKTWTKVSDARAVSLSFVDATHGWAALIPTSQSQPTGGITGDLASTADGGRTWTRYPSPCAPNTGAPITVSFPDAEHGWAGCVAVAGAGNASKSIVATANGGRTWSVRASAPGGDPGVGSIGTYGYLAGIAMAADGSGFDWQGRGIAQWTTDGARNWTFWKYGGDDGEHQPVGGSIEPDGTWVLCEYLNSEHRYAFLTSRDHGATWTEIGSLPGQF